MDSLRIPPTIDFKHGNVAKNWSTWNQKFEIFLLASGKLYADVSVKIATFLNSIGEEGVEIFNTFNIKFDKAKLDDINKIGHIL